MSKHTKFFVWNLLVTFIVASIVASNIWTAMILGAGMGVVFELGKAEERQQAAERREAFYRTDGWSPPEREDRAA